MVINVDTYTGHTWVDNSTPDLEAEVLNEIEEGIRKNNTAIKAVLNALVSQITNDPDKFASMAALYAVNQNLGTLSTTVTNLNSNLDTLSGDLDDKFPLDGNLHLQMAGNLGYTQILKNSSSVADYGTIIANYMQDGSITEIVISDTGIIAVKVDSAGNIISSKPIVTF